MKGLMGAAAAALVLAWAVSAAALEVLAPAPGARVTGEAAWLVLRAAEAPEVTLDGVVAQPRVEAEGVRHYRLAPLPGGRGTVRVGAKRQLQLGERGNGGEGFHQQDGGEGCWECHDGGDGGCGECHPVAGDGKHSPVFAQGCVRCHRGADRSSGGVQQLCVGCHPEFGSGRHGRIRHAVASERDPLRPGRALDCASCHEPHAPRCLSCLPRGELRSWCKRCHGGP